jgi:hypothetical protein
VRSSRADGPSDFGTNPSALRVGDCIDLEETMTAGAFPSPVAKFARRACSARHEWTVVGAHGRVPVADPQGFLKLRDQCLDDARSAGFARPGLDNDPPTDATGAGLIKLHLVTAAHDDPDASGLFWAVCLAPAI